MERPGDSASALLSWTDRVTKKIPSYLKLAALGSAEPAPAAEFHDALLDRIGTAFADATGWRLEYRRGNAKHRSTSPQWSAPINPGVGASPGHLRLTAVGDRAGKRMDRKAVELLASAVGELYGELATTRRALREREAELATDIPVTVRPDDGSRFADSLEAVLRGGAEAVGCQAAALYLLDAGTTELKLRASWNLPPRELSAPARPLRGSLADLEALLGHAVVMNDPALFDYWKVPQACAAAVCVPVSSPTLPLGTLWIFSDTQRDFTDVQTGVIEVVAGRIAADLERHVLAEESLATRHERKLLTVATSGWQSQLPQNPPLVHGWDVGARSAQAGELGGAFHDWFALENDALAVVAGCALQSGASGAMTASALRATARAGSPRRSPEVLLEKANNILWTGASGIEQAALFQAVLQAGAQHVRFASAGPLEVLAIDRDRWQALVTPGSPLGALEVLPQQGWLSNRQHKLLPGSSLLIYSAAALADLDSMERTQLHKRLAEAMQRDLPNSAEVLAQMASRVLAEHGPHATAALPLSPLSTSSARQPDQVVLVIKRQS